MCKILPAWLFSDEYRKPCLTSNKRRYWVHLGRRMPPYDVYREFKSLRRAKWYAATKPLIDDAVLSVCITDANPCAPLICVGMKGNEMCVDANGNGIAEDINIL